METKKIDEGADLANERKNDEYYFDVINKHLDVCHKALEELNLATKLAASGISAEDIPFDKKQQILYRFLSSLYQSAIGYNLSVNGAIAVTKAILDRFETTKGFMEHDAEEKIDRASDKPSSVA